MHRLSENCKVVALAAEDNLSTAATLLNGYLDTAGWDGVLFILAVGALVNTKTLNMKIQHDDASGGSYADITGAALTEIVGDVSAAKNAAYAIDVKCGGSGRKRYMRPVITAGAAAATAVGCVAVLYRGVASPANAAGAGMGERIIV